MIGWLAGAAIARGVPTWWARASAWLSAALLAVIVAGVVYVRIYDTGRDAGAAKVTATVAKRDDDRRVEVRVDEGAAQDVARAIGADVARQTEVVTVQATATEKDIHDAFAKIPAPVAGALPRPAPVDQLRATINAGTERANRAATATDARR